MRSDEHELVLSLVSIWEISMKVQVGKLKAVDSSVAYIRDEAQEYGMEILPIRYEHILAAERLPLHHSEPFDRLIIGQAVVESLPVLTHDRMFPDYPVKLIW